MLRFVLLALLSDEGPRHGYALMKAFEERAGIRLSIGNIYRELQRLVSEGLVVPAAKPADADPRRTPYSITARGREELGMWIGTPARNLGRGSADELAFRLAVLENVDLAEAEAFLTDLEEDLWARAKAVEFERAGDRKRREAHSGPLDSRAVLRSRKAKQLAADIEVVEETRAGIAEWRISSGDAAPADPDAGRARRVARGARGGRRRGGRPD